MECKVVGSNLVRVESHGAWIFLKGEEEIKLLEKKLAHARKDLEQYRRNLVGIPDFPAEERAG